MWKIAALVTLVGCADVQREPPQTAEAAPVSQVVRSCGDLECDIVECVTCYYCNGQVQDPPSLRCWCSRWDEPENEICAAE